MRASSYGIGLLALLAASACTDDALTGPEAQTAYARGIAGLKEIPAGVLVVVDGSVLSSHAQLTVELEAVASIEVIKGDLARDRYGQAASQGVILITTRQTSPTP